LVEGGEGRVLVIPGGGGFTCRCRGEDDAGETGNLRAELNLRGKDGETE